MSAKLLHSLADDNPDLQKQIGCMTGIFQIFDRHHILSGRRLSGQSLKRLLPPDNSQLNGLDNYASNAFNRETMERNSNKYVHEKRVSTESSRASYSSSSRSSSFSSLDCGRAGKPDSSSLEPIIFPEISARDPIISQLTANPKFGRHFLDLRDVVKDSIYQDSQGQSVQTETQEGVGHDLKYRDSPRALQMSKSMDGSLAVGMNGKHELSVDLKESLRVLAKLREAPWYYAEKEVPKLFYEPMDGSISRDAPRFSYDGREVNHLSFESQDTFKSAHKVKDMPRLSLDSRESTARGSNSDPELANVSRNLQRGSDGSNERISSLQKPAAIQARPSSVVAKLMGLEALPNEMPLTTNQLGPIKTYSLTDTGCCSVPLETSDVWRPIQLPNSPRSKTKKPTSSRWKNPDAVKKPISSSKFPIEPAPWKHLNGSQVSPKWSLKQMKSPSVYCESDTRLKDLEFKHSGKDLRAVKQILEAMQAKGLLENPKEEQTSGVGTRRGDNRKYKASGANPPLISSQDLHKNHAVGSMLRGNGSAKAFESPIVIIKPTKLIQKDGSPASFIHINGLPGLHRYNSGDSVGQKNNSASRRTAREQTPKDSHRDRTGLSLNRKTSSRNLRVAQTMTRPQRPAKDNTSSSIKNSGSTSPKLQQRKLDFDKKSRPPTPPDSNKSSRQNNRQPSESSSPGGRRRTKSFNMQQSDDQLCEGSRENGNSSGRGDNISKQSDTCLTLDSKTDLEVTSLECSTEITHCQIPFDEDFNCSVSGEMPDSSFRLIDDDSVEDSPATCPENPVPSPVSVLDACVYGEDSPSPVKQVSHGLQDGEIMNSVENNGEGHRDSADTLSVHTRPSAVTSEMSRQKLENIENLVQKLRRLNSNHDEAHTDYIASLCENTNPEDRYISEILLASGLLLRDLGSGLAAFQLHPSGHPINPVLFLVLEQTKASSLLLKPDKAARLKPDPEKFHRKLIFDAVNEILAQKLAAVGPPPEPWFRPIKLVRNTLNAQKLLRELCADIEQLQPKKQDCCSLDEEEDDLKGILLEDFMHRFDNWTDFHADVSGVVLDVERSIFKDLINEVVTGEAGGTSKDNRSRHCKQLFSK
ncbi:hypothetical protein Nepgr_023749 [Nepenthes gracilis]|uniref:DUF4378 domain-containing protein n=1 Tax=Nepenthes gracilis TaxID=150966 RepID=A0AAD3T4S3_NEPGR|nr:hypothetical protein Nepgr_023749 [Nepenthes gracilis]